MFGWSGDAPGPSEESFGLAALERKPEALWGHSGYVCLLYFIFYTLFIKDWLKSLERSEIEMIEWFFWSENMSVRCIYSQNLDTKMIYVILFLPSEIRSLSLSTSSEQFYICWRSFRSWLFFVFFLLFLWIQRMTWVWGKPWPWSLSYCPRRSRQKRKLKRRKRRSRRAGSPKRVTRISLFQLVW